MQLTRKQKRWLTGIAVGLSAGFFCAQFTQFVATDFFDGLEHVSYDYRHVFQFQLEKHTKSHEIKPIEGIVIVDIDERSLAKLGPYYQWPRSYHGKVVENLSRGGASAILFDIMFKTADFGQHQSESVMGVLNKIDSSIDWTSQKNIIQSNFNYDSLLVSAIANAPGTIGAAFMNRSDAYPNTSDWATLATREWHHQLNPLSSAVLDSSQTYGLPTLPILDNIFPEFARACTRIGLVNVVPDLDGIHRRLPLLYQFPDKNIAGTGPAYTYPVLALQAALLNLGKNLGDITITSTNTINLGYPLVLTKEKNALHVSMRNLSPCMLEELWKRLPQIAHLKETPGKAIRVTSPIVLKKSDEGKVVEIFDGQVLSVDLIRPYLKLTSTWEQFKKEHPAEDSSLARIYNEETEEEGFIDVYTYANLLQKWPSQKWDNLPAGNVITLSTLLDIHYNDHFNQLISAYPALTQNLIEEMQKVSWTTVQNLSNHDSLFFGTPISIPIDENGKMLLRYQGRGGNNATVRYLSYYDVYAGRLDPTLYQGKTFLLGSSAAALFDIVASPFQETYPGVEIHTTALWDILTNSFIHTLNTSQKYTLLCALGLITGLLAYFLPLWAAVISAILLGSLHALVCLWLFNYGWWIEMARPEITIAFSFIVVMIARYIFEEREKKFLNDAFKNYISPELIESMVESGNKPSLGGQEHVLSAYFTDIQGFSTFSEKLGSPTRLVELLNEYLSAMTDVLLKERGTLDKYEGDAIIAFFGAPVPLHDHAHAACIAALEMQSQLGKLRTKWKSEGDKWPEIVHQMRMRIGINTGPIVTGNMGSSVRMNYTMMGDSVNLAARLESVSKQYGVYTLLSQETLDLAGTGFLTREIDRIRVVGKSQPVVIHELLCLESEKTSDIEKCYSLFSKGLELYREQQWDEAINTFEESLIYEPHHPDKNPGCITTPSQVFINRCYKFKTDRRVHVPTDWDGVFTASEK